MDIPQDLNDILQQIAKLEAVVLLLNDYKGIPVCHEALFDGLDLSTGTATLTVHSHQAVCLVLSGETVLQSRLFSLALKAKVASVTLSTLSAQLTGFVPTGYTAEGRRSLRIRPHTVAFATFQFQDRPLTGALSNVSSNGVRLNVPADQVEGDPRDLYQRGDPVHVRILLPGRPGPADYDGQLAYATLHSRVLSLGVNLASDPGAQRALGEYIAQRQAAALPELDRVYAQLAAVAPGSR